MVSLVLLGVTFFRSPYSIGLLELTEEELVLALTYVELVFTSCLHIRYDRKPEVQAGCSRSSLSPAPYPALLPKFWPLAYSGQANSWPRKLRSSSYTEAQILRVPSVDLLHHGHPLGA